MNRSIDIADRVLALAGKTGAEASVLVRESETGHVRFAASEITTSGEVTATDVRLSLSFGQRHASSSIDQVSDASLAALVARTAELAKASPEDPEQMPLLAPQRYVQNARAWDEATAALPASKRAAWARAAIARADDGKDSLVCAGYVESRARKSTLATSTGLRAEHRGTWASMTTTMRTRDGKGSGWAGAEETRAEDLDPAALASSAADRATRSRAPTKLDPGRYTVVLEPAAVANLVEFLVEALDARAADQGRSFFTGRRAGDAIFDPRVTLRSDPLDPRTPGCPWDPDGVPLAPTTWIENGRLKQLYYTRFWAKTKGLAPSGGHGAYMLTSSEPTSPSPAAVLAGVKRGLLVTRFWYTRWLDPRQVLVTGLTRDGVFLIENGVVTRAVNNFRFNDSPVKMLSRLVTATQATWRVPSDGDAMRAPVVCCDDFEMASTSDAV
jgi:predicted Zn-dependent protease